MPIEVVPGDVTRLKADAIANAANERMLRGGTTGSISQGEVYRNAR